MNSIPPYAGRLVIYVRTLWNRQPRTVDLARFDLSAGAPALAYDLRQAHSGIYIILRIAEGVQAVFHSWGKFLKTASRVGRNNVEAVPNIAGHVQSRLTPG